MNYDNFFKVNIEFKDISEFIVKFLDSLKGSILSRYESRLGGLFVRL